MVILRFLEGLRNPVFDVLFSLITRLGEELIFILIGLLFYWCIDKKKGYFLLSVGFIGTLLNQFLKLCFRIPRPWVKDPTFTIVESAREAATGYSFPSGHTQSAVGIFGGIARITKSKIFRCLCVLACILVPLSRMYLGVHTPLDVGVSILIALVLVFALKPLVDWLCKKKKGLVIYFSFLLVASIAFLLFVSFYPFPADIDPHNYESGVKNAYKILGCLLGLFAAYLIDVGYLHFEVKASPMAQAAKLIIGLLPLLAIKEGLRVPLAFLFGEMLGSGVRYSLLTFFAGAIWPMSFPWIARTTDRLTQKIKASKAKKQQKGTSD